VNPSTDNHQIKISEKGYTANYLRNVFEAKI